ncbi:MAG: nucleoside recognition domain-containing protein, partial [Ruthenibacterium lactatiformans]
GKVIVRSILDRTLYVLGRAAMVAEPAGMLIWVMANLTLDGQTLLTRSAAFLDPAARFFGLDGVILLAFILGFPANEIVVPIIIMAYLSTGSLVEMNDLSALHTLLVQNGWTWVTAVCTMLFSLMHWPCSTTCLTIARNRRAGVDGSRVCASHRRRSCVLCSGGERRAAGWAAVGRIARPRKHAPA